MASGSDDESSGSELSYSDSDQDLSDRELGQDGEERGRLPYQFEPEVEEGEADTVPVADGAQAGEDPERRLGNNQWG